MYTAVPQKIMSENPQLDFAIVGVFGDNEYTLWELFESFKKPARQICRFVGWLGAKSEKSCSIPPAL